MRTHDSATQAVSVDAVDEDPYSSIPSSDNVYEDEMPTSDDVYKEETDESTETEASTEVETEDKAIPRHKM